MGAQQRRYHLLRAYAEAGWSVSLIAICRDAAEEAAVDGVREYCDAVELVPYRSTWGAAVSRWPLWRQRLNDLLSAAPWGVRRYRSPLMAHAIRNAASTCDVLHLSRAWCAGDLPAGGSRAQIVLDLDDVESLVQTRALEAGLVRGRARMLARLEALRMRRFERRLARRARLVLVCSDLDAARLNEPNVAIVPNGVDLKVPAGEPGAGDGRTILFVGFMPYPPNADAVRFFGQRVLPRVRRQRPDARFVVVGKGSEQLSEVGDGLELVGAVPDLAPYYLQASVVVAPLRVGGGTRIKILEAFAWQRPVVATTIGAEALPVESGRDLFIADADDDLAARCVQLLNDPALRRTLAVKARALVDGFDWTRLRPLLTEAVERAVRR
jgi:glycosyltransferase involved in cell wall biosynthesis